MIKRYFNQSVNGPFSLLYHHNQSKWKDMLLIVIVINSLQSQKNDFTNMRKTLVFYIISLRSIDSQFRFLFLFWLNILTATLLQFKRSYFEILFFFGFSPCSRRFINENRLLNGKLFKSGFGRTVTSHSD